MEKRLNYDDSLSSIKSHLFQNIEAWREEAYRMINQYCETKRVEFVELLDQEQAQQQLDLIRLRAQINQCREEQNPSEERLDSTQNSIQTTHKRVTQISNIQSQLSPLNIEPDLICFRSNKSISKNILPFSSQFQVGLLEGNKGCIAANNDHFVIIQENALCLYELRWPMVRAFPWNFVEVYDMLWSRELDQFIFIVEEKVLTFNDKTMTVSPLSLSDNQDPIDFYAGTCSGNSLFLITQGPGPSIYVYAFRPLLELKRKYQPPFPYTVDERILHCASNYQSIAMLIKHRQDGIRLDLRSPMNMEQFWTVNFGLTSVIRNIRCCSVNHYDWMVICYDHSTLFHISAEGELVNKAIHHPPPWYGMPFINNELLILSDSMMTTYLL